MMGQLSRSFPAALLAGVVAWGVPGDVPLLAAAASADNDVERVPVATESEPAAAGAVPPAAPAPVAAPARSFGRVVIDPGHGGIDRGARGKSGLVEKEVALDVGLRIGRELEARGVEVVYTRDEDRFVSLLERTEIANSARADLYLSIHANAAEDSDVRGPETYFLSLAASDDEALRVAMAENEVFDHAQASPDASDLVGSILGDLIRTEHLRASSEVAMAIQHGLAELPGPSRGLKQAPFVVLMGVNMPAALLEIGFITNAREARSLSYDDHRSAVALAVADAVVSVERPHTAGFERAER